MAKFFQELNAELQTFIAQQKIFFVATAMAEGRINLSPKGMDSFRIWDPQTVGFLNVTGSGNETAAHLAHQDRITLMFCSFEEKPLILRLYGHGQEIRPSDPDWATHLAQFPDLVGKRQIIRIKIDRIQTSCGYAVPFFDYQGEREQLLHWAEKKGEEGIRAYQRANNHTSIDGVPIALD